MASDIPMPNEFNLSLYDELRSDLRIFNVFPYLGFSLLLRLANWLNNSVSLPFLPKYLMRTCSRSSAVLQDFKSE